MSKIESRYWICQISGWLFYGLTNIFFATIFNLKFIPRQYVRLYISIALGLLLTHLLRLAIIKFKLRPPIQKQKWLLIFVVVLSTCFLYSLCNSAIVEAFGLFDPTKKVSLITRSLYNLLNDSPIVIVWVSIYYVWHYILLSANTQIEQLNMQSQIKELELKTIKSHINPHFIFNALNSIRALVDENPVRARTAITELSNILRSSMQAEKAETTPLESELNIVKDYLALEHIRFEDRLKIEYEIDEDTLDQPMPPMMLQTLVENAIKHGIGKQKGGGIVKIISDFKDDHHELIVQNTGNLNGEYNHNGFGIASTKNRLLLLFGNNASFELRSISDTIIEAKIIMPVTV